MILNKKSSFMLTFLATCLLNMAIIAPTVHGVQPSTLDVLLRSRTNKNDSKDQRLDKKSTSTKKHIKKYCCWSAGKVVMTIIIIGGGVIWLAWPRIDSFREDGKWIYVRSNQTKSIAKQDEINYQIAEDLKAKHGGIIFKENAKASVNTGWCWVKNWIPSWLRDKENCTKYNEDVIKKIEAMKSKSNTENNNQKQRNENKQKVEKTTFGQKVCNLLPKAKEKIKKIVS